MSDSLWPHGLYSLWYSPGQNTGLGNLYLLQGIFSTQGSNPGLPHCRRILYQLSHKGSPRILEWVAYPFSSGSSWPRNQTGISCIAGGFFTNWAIREAHSLYMFSLATYYSHSELVLKLFMLRHIELLDLKIYHNLAVYESTYLLPYKWSLLPIFPTSTGLLRASFCDVPCACVWVPSGCRHLEVGWLGCRICTFSIWLSLPNDSSKYYIEKILTLLCKMV